MLVAKLIFPTCRRSFWFLCCCLLLTNEFIVHAAVTPSKSSNKLEPVPSHGQISPRGPQKESQCYEWQVLKGDECTCAESAAVACKDASGGIVCDNYGNQYPSVCHFLVQMCNGEISTRHELDTCGLCSSLRLTDSNVLPISSVLFAKTNDSEQIVKYESQDNQDLSIYFETKLDKWMIGQRNGKEQMLVAIFVDTSPFVQDSQKGAFVVRQNLSRVQQEDKGTSVNFETLFEYDAHLHLECINSQDIKNSEVQRHARFFPIIFAFGVGAGLTIPTTTITLAVAQKAKGCLYYPSVCTMRDKIQHTLRPRLSKLRDDFIQEYGSNDSFKRQLEETKYSLNEIKAHLITISQLLKLLNPMWENTLKEAKGLEDLITIEFDESLVEIKAFDKLVNNNLITESISFSLTVLEAGITVGFAIYGTLSATLAAVTVAFAALGIVLNAVSIGMSANEERKLRDNLQESTNKLKNGISNMEKAWVDIAKIQSNLDLKLVNPLRTFSKTVYDNMKENTFKKLYLFLSTEYKGSKSINLNWLIQLQKHLQKVLIYTGNNVNQLHTAIRNQEEMQRYLDTIKEQVETFKSPSTILKSLQHVPTPEMFKEDLSSLSVLLHYISRNILPTSQCFMGYDLISARHCKSCYDQDLICDAPQLNRDKQNIKRLIKEQKPVCLIKKELKSDIFDNIYQVVKYIANYVIPTSFCYWGYNLAEVRFNKILRSDINKSHIDRTIMLTISNLEVSYDTYSSVKTELCSVGICNNEWQNMLLCIGNSEYALGLGIYCHNSYDNCPSEVTKRLSC